MKKIIVLIILIIIVGSLYILLRQDNKSIVLFPSVSISPANQDKIVDNFTTEVIAQNLDTPWAIAFLPDNSMLVTERSGNVSRLDQSGFRLISQISNAQEIGEGGLLGITLHPNFSSNNYVYFYYTYRNSGENTFNRVVRMTYEGETLKNEEVIVDNIPGNSNHNGGRIKFGPDGYLYIATGDAQNPSYAQDKNSLAGKILRTTDIGDPAPNNPFNNLVYSYGHRNVQGLAWNEAGGLWTTEHGRSGLQSGLDELNLIQSGKNYGWPDIQGNESKQGMETPKRNSGNDTWAPSGAAFVDNALFFSGLRGEALYEAVIEGEEVVDFKEHFKEELGRIREVILGSDRMLYITTSNNDGRGSPKAGDDKIIKVNPEKL